MAKYDFFKDMYKVDNYAYIYKDLLLNIYISR